jgi:hypothetical protein
MHKVLLFIIFFTTPFLALAQGIRFSVFADPQISWLKPEVRSVESAGLRIGYDIGLEMDNFFSENYSFSTGLSLNHIGGRLRFNQQDEIMFESSSESEIINPGDIVAYRLQYLNIPMGMKFTTRQIGYSTLYVRMGLGGHFNIKSNASISSLGIENESLKDEIEFFNLSYNFGLGIQYSLGGRTAVTGGLEYRHRFMDIASNPDFKALLNSLSIRLGLLF